MKSEEVNAAQRGAARWEFLNVNHLIERAGLDPKADAVVIGEDKRNYGDLKLQARRVGNALLEAGVQPCDRVAITARNRIEYFEIEFGTSEAAAIMVAMSWRLTADERIRLLQRSYARVVFAEADFVAPLAAARAAGELPELRVIVSFDPCQGADLTYAAFIESASTAIPQVVPPRMTDTHEIIYTSGTTGEPKGVMWSHGTVLWNNTQQIIDFGLRPGDSNYVALDLNYIGGRHDFTLALIQQGGTVHLRPSGGFDAAEVLHYLVDNQITHVLWVPTMLHDILQLDELLEKLDTSKLKMIMCGGSPLSEEIIARAQNAFPHTDFVQVFGLTEGGGTPTFVPKDRLKDKIGSAGLASIFNEVRIVGDDSQECPPGEVGEIQVRGPAVTPGYWGNIEASAALVEEGWLHTGDLGRKDEEGFLYVAGRAKDLIISGGMNIFPADVEHVIAEYPSVEMVSVIGLPDERWGETVCAVVKIHEAHTVTADEIITHCKARIASYKKPTSVVFVEGFPLTVSGKIRKVELVERVLRSTAERAAQ